MDEYWKALIRGLGDDSGAAVSFAAALILVATSIVGAYIIVELF